MKKTRFLVGLTLSILLGGCTLSQNTQTPAGNAAVPEANTEESLTSSMRDLMQKGGSLKCNFSSQDSVNKSTSTGTIYLSDGKFSQEVVIKITEPKPIETKINVISDGEYFYSWDTSRADSGIKMKVNKETVEEGQKADKTKNATDLDKKMDMKCQKWTVDQSKFKIPTDINFVDYSQMMENIKAKMPSLPSGVPTIPKDIPLGE